ncbi:MAG: NrfD/PsrC family molybdoenzyme membrane anchor subunit, partial [Candidatus Hydrogenedentota bacterium]
GYLLYMKYEGRRPTPLFYVPLVLISIAWAISIHTVTAFLYVGLVGRPFWNAAIVAPRFLGSAFTVGPAILIITFQVLARVTELQVGEKALYFLRQVVTASLLINLFLLSCEMFKEFYSGSLHNASARYLFFGLHGHNQLVPWIWSAIAMEIVAAIILVVPPIARKHALLNLACVFSIIGIWIEKGMGLVVPGFIPSPLGNIVEYVPSWNEVLVCLGIWAFGALLFSWMLHLAIPIMSGSFARTSSETERLSSTTVGETA